MASGSKKSASVKRKAPQDNLLRAFEWVLLGVILLGAGLRFYNMWRTGFFFFDEGMYLNYARDLFKDYLAIPHKTTADVLDAIHHWFLFALQTDRPFWQLIVDVRVFFGGETCWRYPR